jgi:hypothetical protein
MVHVLFSTELQWLKSTQNPAMKTVKTNPPDTVAGQKLEYSTPQLKNYGALTDLTQSGKFLGNDGNTTCTGNSNSAESPCDS